MNILPHKSWHVRTKANIERVRKDEEKAAEEEKEKQRRVALAEQEARTSLLRERAKKRTGEEIEGTPAEKIPKGIDDADTASTSRTVGIYTSSGNINLFKDAEAGEIKSGKNVGHEAERKAEKEKWEKDIGLLTYLGQSAVEKQEKLPWYLSKKKEKQYVDPVERDRKLKDSLDPLRQMSEYVHKSQKHSHNDEDKDKHQRHKHKKKKKEKHEEHKKDKHSSASKTIEQLRAERLRREQEERKKTDALLSRNKGHEKKVIEEPMNERDRGYNSVFNPDLVRKPRNRHSYEDRYL